MNVLREMVEDLVAQLDGPNGGNAYHTLIDHPDAAPLLVEAYRREPDVRRRVGILEVIGYFALPAQAEFLAEALSNAAPQIWKEALNGLVRLGGQLCGRMAQTALERVRAEFAGASPLDGERLEWIDEAIEQLKEDAPSIQPLQEGNWDAVRTIYEEGMATGNATFQIEAPSWEAWSAGHCQHSRLVAVEHGIVRGWAALSPVSSRCVYSGVAEVSVYVAAGARNRGIGRLLLEALVLESQQNGIWTLQAGIFPENVSSIAVHVRCGFRIVGRREKLGQMKDGRWRDVLLLERRSSTIGGTA